MKNIRDMQNNIKNKYDFESAANIILLVFKIHSLKSYLSKKIIMLSKLLIQKYFF